MSGPERINFRRIVLDLCAMTHDGEVMRLAADLARLLHLDLQGLYMEDPALALLANLPCVRELRLPGAGWERLDADRITAEIQQTTARASRHLAEISAAFGVPSGFETRRGNAAEIIAHSEPTDILLLVEPRQLLEQPGGEFVQRCLAAYHSVASVLLVPAGRQRPHGAVVAVAASANEAGLTVAAHIAEQSGEDLVLLLTDMARQPDVRERVISLGVRPAQLRVHDLPSPDARGIAQALAGTYPRLLVLTRGAAMAEDIGFLIRLARERRVPILAVEPHSGMSA